MTDHVRCDFSLIRYVPDPVKNEFVNIGVVLREAARPETAQVRFTRDWGRVRCVDPEADVGMLEALEAEMRARLAETGAGSGLMKTMEDSFSHLLQITEAKACLAENMAAEMEQLMRLYVEPRKDKARAAVSGRQAIVRQMRSHFERAQVWDLMRKRIAAAAYTRPGDGLKIDCGYKPNGVIRMFHGISLTGDAELAKVLAFSAPGLREGVRRVENAELELTAIVEPLRNGRGEVVDEPAEAEYRFGVEAMEAQQIRVLTVSDLERVADTARRELRV
ncbi:MAG: DUF3037 domain-containing protein [Acidobacteriaceae bacterium]